MKICFVALNAYGVLAGRDNAHFGGAESQVQLMSAWFKKRGHDVTVVVWDEGGPELEEIDGVRLIKFARRSDGFRVMRFFWPRWAYLNKALRLADADLYIQNCAEHTTGQIAIWCKRHRRRFVYLVASNADCARPRESRGAYYNRWLFRYGLLNNSQVIAQTNFQRDLLKTNYSISATTIPMAGTPKEHGTALDEDERHSKRQVLWVGRICRIKRIEMLLDVAQKMPDVTFNIVGKGDDDDSYVSTTISKIKAIPNVVYHGAVARGSMPAHYGRTCILCCTSTLEGFPNVFLESWSHGNPVVSTFDPDGVITSRRLGVAVKDSPEMVAAIKTLLSNRTRWVEFSKNATQYFETNHLPDSVFTEYENIFKQIAAC